MDEEINCAYTPEELDGGDAHGLIPLYTTPQTAQQSIPDGYVLVPAELTAAMRAAAKPCTTVSALWASIIAAAPQPAAQQAAQFDRDAIAVNLLRLAGLDKHKARECAEIVMQVLAAATPQPAPQQEPDAMHLAAMDLARKHAQRIAELEAEVERFRQHAPNEKSARQVLEQQIDKRLFDLLCRIHRDGGHYIAENGLEKALRDADMLVAGLNALSDAQAAYQRIGTLYADNWPGWRFSMGELACSGWPVAKAVFVLEEK